MDQPLFIKFLQYGRGKSLLVPEIATAYGRAQEQHTRSLATRTLQPTTPETIGERKKSNSPQPKINPPNRPSFQTSPPGPRRTIPVPISIPYVRIRMGQILMQARGKGVRGLCVELRGSSTFECRDRWDTRASEVRDRSTDDHRCEDHGCEEEYVDDGAEQD